jgi:predicted enzyme related to lactoylglutathione lyase
VPGLLVNLDVDDIEHAVRFYTEGLGLRVGRRFDEGFVELVGLPVPLYLLLKAQGSIPFDGAPVPRRYDRHWTGVHLDFVVDEIEPAIERAVRAGARLETDAVQHAYGKLALLSDPFGHGFCLLQFTGRGYAEL